MLKWVKTAIILILLGAIAFSGAFLCGKWGGNNKVATISEDLGDSIARMELSDGIVSLKSKDLGLVRLRTPRTGSIGVEIDSEGRVHLRKASIWPVFCLLPQLSIAVGQQLEPSMSIQFVRSERLGVGLSLGFTPSMGYMSFDKDMGSKYAVGIFANPNTFGLKVSLFL